MRDWYFTQASQLDPRARTLPFPDSLMGRLLEFVVAHEIGHTLGLQHDQIGSSTYPADSVRSATWVHTHGTQSRASWTTRASTTSRSRKTRSRWTTSCRASVRTTSTRSCGATSRFPTRDTPDDERPTLEQWARMQDTRPVVPLLGEQSRSAATARRAKPSATPIR